MHIQLLVVTTLLLKPLHLELLSQQQWEVFPVPLLLNFLKASPSLQKINNIITEDPSHADVSPDEVLVLPSVKDFFLDLIRHSFC